MHPTRHTVLGLIAAALLFQGAIASAQAPGCGEFQPCEQSLQLGRISAVRVWQTSVRSAIAPEAPHDCRRFRVTARYVRHYLRHAGRVSDGAWHYATAMSPCVSLGSARIDGRLVQWTLGEGLEAELHGLPGGALRLYCSRCAQPPGLRRKAP